MAGFKKENIVVGLMSGTSLDGLDFACCNFICENNEWSFNLIKAETVTYSAKWMEKLYNAPQLDKNSLENLHLEYGQLLGKLTRDFINKNNLKPMLVASHGHTVFHEPAKGITFQLGLGSAIAEATGINVVSDFRSLDVSLGGQGAPLVPVGDRLLFPDYDYCLNLGGFANISFENNRERIAFDICPVNIALNHIVRSVNKEFDDNGNIAGTGKINMNLLSELNNLDYYRKKHPKSLGREWFQAHFIPVIENNKIDTADLLSTVCEHIAIQINSALKHKNKNAKLFITGGGAHNGFLIRRIKDVAGVEVIIPDKDIVNFKEAVIFGLLGVLRMRNETNCLKSVTGASRDSSTGVISLSTL